MCMCVGVCVCVCVCVCVSVYLWDLWCEISSSHWQDGVYQTRVVPGIFPSPRRGVFLPFFSRFSSVFMENWYFREYQQLFLVTADHCCCRWTCLVWKKLYSRVVFTFYFIFIFISSLVLMAELLQSYSTMDTETGLNHKIKPKLLGLFIIPDIVLLSADII